jgi:RNA polymerase subunit RPABC4/transcription elongation factor Spt4
MRMVYNVQIVQSIVKVGAWRRRAVQPMARTQDVQQRPQGGGGAVLMSDGWRRSARHVQRDEQRTCPNCGEPVTDTDTVCPNCGEPLSGGVHEG